MTSQRPDTLASPLSTASPTSLLVDDARFDRHAPPGHHPERPERLSAGRDAVARSVAHGVKFERIASRAATNDELARVHDAQFLEALARLRGEAGYLDPDTYVSADSIEVARLAAGSLVAMVDAILDGPTKKGAALLRPPGHHARPARAMGFCLLNNVAVAAAHAKARGIERVAVVDWDVHHGNGTQEIFWNDPGVLYISTHQSPFYPGTGEADEVGLKDGKGYTVNVPLSAGGGDAVYRSAFDRVILPVLDAYSPGLVLVSAGFDASARDPLGQMELTPQAFGWMARELARVADRSAQGRMALVLEGGYDLASLEAGLERALDGMLTGRAAEIAALKNEDDAVSRAASWAKKGWSGVG